MASKSSDLPELPELPDLPDLPDLPSEVSGGANTANTSDNRSDRKSTSGKQSKSAAPPKQTKTTPAKSSQGNRQSTPKPAQATAGVAKPAPLAELKPEAVEQAGAAANDTAKAPGEKAAAAADSSGKAGERPPLRSIAGAPQHLKKAAMFVTAGAILPFMNHGGSWPIWAGKALVLLGAFLWFKQVEHNWGPKLTGFLGSLAEMRKKEKKKEATDKPARRSIMNQDAVAALEHPFPTGLHLLSLILILAGALGLPLFVKPETPLVGKAIAELGILAWGAATIVHIHAYERWGKFNPIFPLLFAGMAFAGVMSVIGGLGGAADGLTRIAMILGGALVAGGGGLAAFTIVEAMMEAKKEGDVKKQAQLDERRQARDARRKASK